MATGSLDGCLGNDAGRPRLHLGTVYLGGCEEERVGQIAKNNFPTM